MRVTILKLISLAEDNWYSREKLIFFRNLSIFDKMNLPQVDLGSEAGVRQATVSMAESVSDTMQLSTSFALIRVFGLETIVQPNSEISVEQY